MSRSVSSQSFPPSRPAPAIELSPAEKEKAGLIAAACRDRDLDTLVHLATSTSGLLSDDLRRSACMLPYYRTDCYMTNKCRASSARSSRQGSDGEAMEGATTVP